MKRNSEKIFIENMLKHTDVSINGPNPWDIQVHNENLYKHILTKGTLGLGEAYRDGWWDCERLDILFDKLLSAKLDQKISLPFSALLTNFLAHIINFQTRRKAKEVAVKHYNLDKALFDAMLDKNKMYSCAYFKETDNLDEAQIAKLQLSCEKLKLKPGMRLLDIGCGWGGLARYAAQHFGVEVVGITISEEQYTYAKAKNKDLNIDIRLQDYRDIDESFDRVISIGMFEHVGPMNYAEYMHKVHSLLVQDGLFLLHTIGGNEKATLTDPFIRKYIFPNAVLPCTSQITEASEKLFILEDWQNFGTYYDKTLMAWDKNFKAHWEELKPLFDERFYRLWTYYLQTCAGSFRARYIQLWQIVFSKEGMREGYMAPR